MPCTTGFDDDMQTTAGLYVHWPYCQSKCRYCDFFSTAQKPVDYDGLLASYLADMAFFKSNAKAHTLHSIHFGGGTPSLMPDHVVAAILEQAAKLWTLPKDCEITAEINPASGITTKLESFAKLGVNRISVGVQSLDNDVLAMFGRAHNSTTALHTLDTAQKLFTRLSADFIYARPGQTLADWDGELAKILALGLKHLSLYQLTADPQAHWIQALEQQGLSLPDEKTGAALYTHTQSLTNNANMPAYETSNHAAGAGHYSRHNTNVWRGGVYFGIGAGAHSRFIDHAGTWQQMRLPENTGRWQNLQKHKFGRVTFHQRGEELVILGLRLKEGLSLKRLENATKLPISDIINIEKAKNLADQGLLLLDKKAICTTLKGTMLADRIALEILDI